MRKIVNEIIIDKPVEEIFDFVTRPARWYEWFVSSQKSNLEDRSFKVEECFSIDTIQKLFETLPFQIKKTINYKVVEYTPPSNWRIVAESPEITTDTSYEISDLEGKSKFTRVFIYNPKGIFKIIEPILLRRTIARDAEISLHKLKSRIE